jgi:hypothetical protein
MRLLFILVFACVIAQFPSLAQQTVTYDYQKHGKNVTFVKENETISLAWKKKTGTTPKELHYSGFAQPYKLVFRGAHPTVLYRGNDIVAHFKDLDILINNKIYHYGEGIRDHWVFMMKDSIVVDCRYEEPADRRTVNIMYGDVAAEDIEILKVLAFKRGSEVAHPRSNMGILIGTGAVIGVTTALVAVYGVE